MSIWKPIDSEAHLKELLEKRDGRPILILKHSPRCSLSFMAKNRLERNQDERLDYFLIDVIRNRNVSNALANITGVRHESPQAFLFAHGEPVSSKSHSAVNSDAFSKLVDALA